MAVVSASPGDFSEAVLRATVRVIWGVAQPIAALMHALGTLRLPSTVRLAAPVRATFLTQLLKSFSFDKRATGEERCLNLHH